jgi:pyrroloquinoline quinone (PQQ) biosynthesis protein C
MAHIAALVLATLHCVSACSPSLADAGRAHSPLPPKTLEEVAMLEQVYRGHPGYKHFIWDHMAKGEYDLKFLQQFALHYYEHVRVFRLYLAGAMTAVPIEAFQVKLAEIIADEFGVRLFGEPDVDGHPELFRRFMRSIGLTEDDWERIPTGKNLIPGVAHYKRVHYGMFQTLPEEIVGAIIFGMERTTPHRHSSMLAGLQKFAARSGIAVDPQFFAEHVAVDDYHNHALIEPLADWFEDPVAVDRMKQGALRSFDARLEFLDNLAGVLGVQRPVADLGGEVAGTGGLHIDLAREHGPVVVDFQWIDVHELKPHEHVDAARSDVVVAASPLSPTLAPLPNLWAPVAFSAVLHDF